MVGKNTREPRPTERVYKALRQDLASQHFRYGERLPINELATHYRVSATPVREALSRLYGEQLISYQSGYGYYFQITPLEDLKDHCRLLDVLLVTSLSQSCANSSKIAIDLSEEQKDANDIHEAHDKFNDIVKMILDYGGNRTSFQVGSNLLWRIAFIVKEILAIPEYRTEIEDISNELQTLVHRSDLTTAQAKVNTLINTLIDKVQVLLPMIVARPYIAGTNKSLYQGAVHSFDARRMVGASYA